MREDRLIRAVQRTGSRRAAERLVEAHYDEILAYAWRQTGDREAALDATQEIFVAALRGLPTFDPLRASFRTWLFRVATNKLIDLSRRAGQPFAPLDGIELPVEDRGYMRVLDGDLARRIEAAVARADPFDQAVFRLRVYSEQSFPEIARITGQRESTVKSRYHRLVARLRKEFDHEG